jgi:hypothetical protein
MKFAARLAAVLPFVLLAVTGAVASPAQADTGYYDDAGYCFTLWNNTGWTLQSQFLPSLNDEWDNPEDVFPNYPAQLAPGQQTQMCTGLPDVYAALQYSNSVESFTIGLSTTSTADQSPRDAIYMHLSNGIVRHVGNPDTLELHYTPATDAAGDYVWGNATAFDFPDIFSLASPQGSHQQSCSSLNALRAGLPSLTLNTVQLRAWNDPSATTAWTVSSLGTAHLRLTTDGNLQIVVDQTNQVAWSSNTAPNPGHAYSVTLKLQTDGNLALYGASGQYLWDAKVAPVCP